jgi:mycothiol synthase
MDRIDVVSQPEARLEQLPELLRAAACADGHEAIGEHKFLRLQQGDDLAAAIAAYEHDELVGYAHTLAYGDGADRRVSCEVVVHPGARRRGVGQALLARAVEHARSQAAGRIDVWAYNDSVASRRLAVELGFTPTRRLLHLHRHVSDTFDVEPPAGIRLRPFDAEADAETLLALNNRIFAGHPENGTWTLEDLRARMRQPWFDARDVLLAELDSSLAGFCWLKVEHREGEGRVGEIYVIGTAPEARGLGLGRYLLAEALRHLPSRGARVAAIYVDESNETAVRLYASCGFHHHHVDVCYSRAVAPASQAAATKSEVAA